MAAGSDAGWRLQPRDPFRCPRPRACSTAVPRRWLWRQLAAIADGAHARRRLHPRTPRARPNLRMLRTERAL
eukprot:472605-Prymnesium_polylepis.1